METRPCSSKDFRFGIDDDNPDAMFYPTVNSLTDLEVRKDIFLCIKDPGQMYVYGNY